ncbi:hypothetical protein CWB96_01905 [Pseudoalteromonas citrea]|uniref:Uncharacterized protein n=1 Tax=Pseudoalteromonas citrea TaxID=43655 RepID=A0A5S3XUS2_9GAMM|nr:hypothetical protein [Pseudoalteromonas citrea]TMP43491.1 hypothetical protein CWB97_09615 [Pseudoalteromonas citrea]TMP62110.1 hypothetical protein CWB96_01905 [Pseudoalteromonas citrea]
MNILLYGINSITSTLTTELKELNNLEYACTTGEQFFGSIKAHTLSELIPDNHTKVIICSMCVDEITNDLVAKGFDINKIYFFNSATCTVQSCQEKLVEPVKDTDILYSVFDLSRNIASFDVVWLATRAELERQERGLKKIHFVIIPREQNDINALAVRTNYDYHDELWRLSHIIVPTLKSLQTTSAVSEFSNKQQAYDFLKKFKNENLFPRDFNHSLKGRLVRFDDLDEHKSAGRSIEVFDPSDIAKNLVSSFISSRHLEGKELITFTIREYEVHQERNSTLDVWLEFAKTLDADKFALILIRDTYKSSEPLPKHMQVFIECPLASIDIQTRIAFYQAAYINLSSASGPSILPYFIPNAPSIRFMQVSNDHFATSEEYFNTPGFNFGSKPSFAEAEHHEVIWQKEALEPLKAAFNKLNTYLGKE